MLITGVPAFGVCRAERGFFNILHGDSRRCRRNKIVRLKGSGIPGYSRNRKNRTGIEPEKGGYYIWQKRKKSSAL